MMSHGSYESLVCTVRLHYTGMNPFFKAAKVTQSREIPNHVITQKSKSIKIGAEIYHDVIDGGDDVIGDLFFCI